RFLQNFQGNESTPAVLFHLGTAYYNLKQYEEAITNYQRLCSDFPDTEFVAPALFNAGLCYKKTSKLSEAAAVYAKFIEQYPKDKMVNDALLELVAIYKDQFRYNLAIPAINNLLTKLDAADESRLELIYSLAECYTEMDDEKSSIDQYLKLRAMTPANNVYRLRALAKLGEMYENKKDWVKAIDIYKDIAQNTDREDWRTAVKERIEVISEGMKKK
ncbi:tetratricopeptide repeat protein, partial [Candidatus Desantisbacteria bacterium]|nr:tetratricopeptide repeat protein [Candidatus Desantisbacteria bacterium]